MMRVMRIRILLYVCMLAVLVGSCSKDEVMRDGSHGSPDPTNPLPDNRYDVPDDEIADATPRMSSDAMSLRFGDVGVMVLSGDDPVCDFELRNIDTGHYLRLSSDGAQGTGLINPTIEIDGELLQLAGHAVARHESSVWWIVAETLSGDSLLIVVSDVAALP